MRHVGLSLIAILLLGLVGLLITQSSATAYPALAAGHTNPGRAPQDGASVPQSPAAQGEESSGPIVSAVSRPSVSPALRDLPLMEPGMPTLDREINPRVPPTAFLDGPVELPDGGPDPLLGQGENPGFTPPPILSFDGVSFATGGTGSPPDTVGDVGPNHYVQSVNGSFQIFDKSGGTLAGPTANNALWAGFGGPCQTRNDGDPIVLYDQLANRWLISQFTSVSPYNICVAISTTPDPTGTYYRYAFQNTVNVLQDYFKFGVWPNAYYMSANESTYTAYAFDRTRMLAGLSATFIKFTGETNMLMPADVDGATAPPSGAPGYFYTFKDNVYASHGGGVDRLELFEFAPNFTTPASSTFTNVTDLPVAAYTYTVCGFFVLNCVPQSGTTRGVDAVSEWPMFRLAYRNFGTHQAMVGNFAVDVGSDRSGIRWFELRKIGAAAWTLFQEGTHAPGTEHRFMGSIAQDRQGNIAMGYNVSSSTMFPAIRYATRLTTDAAGTLQAEQTLQAGGGAQTATHSRWGDYSALSVDPANGCTFWYTNEYFATTGSSWRTRIGTFQIPECIPLAVELSLFEAQPEPRAVAVRWESALETDTLGFNLLRGPDSSTPTSTLNATLIPAQGAGVPYAWQDQEVRTGQTYFYWLEAVATDGSTARYGPVSATYEASSAVTLGTLSDSTSLPNPLWAVGALVAVVGLALVARRLRA